MIDTRTDEQKFKDLDARVKALEDMHVTGDEHDHPDRAAKLPGQESYG
jgi:hypothetical protein